MLFKIIEGLGKISAYLAAFVLILMTAYTLIEIALRALFGISSNVLVEFVGYALAAMTFLGAAQTMREGGMIRVSILLQFTPPRLRQFLDAFCLVVGICIVGFLARFVWLDMQRSYDRGYETDSVVTLPLWVPPLGLLIGMTTFLIEMVMMLFLVVSGRATLPVDSPDAI